MIRPQRRYSSATVLGGRLHLDPGPVYLSESQVDAILNPRVGSRKIRTAEELEQTVRGITRLPSIRIWIAEGLKRRQKGSVTREAKPGPRKILIESVSLRNMDSGDKALNDLLRSSNRTALRNLVIGEVVLSVVWGLLGRVVLSGGTPMVVLNISFLLLSLYLAWAMVMILRFRFSPFVSGLISALVWVLVFGVLRGLF